MTRPFTLRDFCEPGDTYVDLTTGERIVIPDDPDEGENHEP